MNKENQRVDYVCPLAKTCKLHKKCHVLSTVHKLNEPIRVRQICPAEGRDVNGRKVEIEIEIG